VMMAAGEPWKRFVAPEFLAGVLVVCRVSHHFHTFPFIFPACSIQRHGRVVQTGRVRPRKALGAPRLILVNSHA